MSYRQETFDVIVVGTGIAGLSAAVRAAECGASVCVLTKEASPEECNTRYAQGGIVARGGPEDPRPPGAGHSGAPGAGSTTGRRCASSAGRAPGPWRICSSGKAAACRSIAMPRARSDLTREAAHSIRRIWHVKDYTGRAIQESLTAYARGIVQYPLLPLLHGRGRDHQHPPLPGRLPALRRPSVPWGLCLRGEHRGGRALLRAGHHPGRGGVGNLYLHTSNPPGRHGRRDRHGRTGRAPRSSTRSTFSSIPPSSSTGT
ncbi:MAG: FAD-binding protein [Candidatus Moduliflexus flocculans]|nr:FAD-binding protein [Candidatus Moduliflexus flocculans]